MLVGLLTALLGACAPQSQVNAPPAPAAASVPVPPSARTAPAGQPVPEDAQLATKPDAGIDARQLPEDVQAYILRHRMCKHMSGGTNTTTATSNPICAAASADAWKAMIRKYQGQDQVTGVLLAEKPDGIKGMEGLTAAPPPVDANATPAPPKPSP